MAGAVVAFFLLLCGGTGLLDLLWPAPAKILLGQERIEEEERRAQARFVDGSLARLLERDLKLRSRVRQAVLPPWSAVLYGALGAWPPEVVRGADGWLYLRSRIEHSALPVETLTARPATIIAALRRRLAAAGYDFLVVPIPEKSMVYPQHLPPRFRLRPELQEGLMRELERWQVPRVDLLDLYRRHPETLTFCRTDSHWSWEGALLAAEAIAQATGTLVPERERLTAIRHGATMPDAGDLLAFTGLDVEALQRPCLEGTILRAFGHLKPLVRPEIYDLAGNLLAEAFLKGPEGASVLHAGTSYSGWPLFQGYLTHFSGRRIRAESVPGGLASHSLSRLAQMIQERQGERPPRTLVWEFMGIEAFVPEVPFYDLGEPFARLPTAGLEPLVLPKDGPVFAPDSTLRLGTNTLGGGAWKVLWTRPGSLLVPEDGAVSIRLQGVMAGGSAEVVVDSGSGQLRGIWKPEATELVLPFMGESPGAALRVSVRALSGEPTLELAEAALVSDLDPETGQVGEVGAVATSSSRWRQAVRFEEAPLSLGAVVILRFQAAAGLAGPVVVRLELEGGTGRPRVQRLAPLLPGALAMVAATPCGAGRLARVVLEGEGRPEEVLSEARIVLPRRHP